jgi:hypothetical protein
MLGQKAFRRLASWLLATASCAGAVDPAPLEVQIPETQARSRAPVPPDEGFDQSEQPSPALSAELSEWESRERAEATLKKLRPRIEACFSPHARLLQSRRVVVNFTLRGTGKASSVSVEPNLGVVSLRKCVRDVLGKTRFDRPPRDGLRFSVPLELRGP